MLCALIAFALSADPVQVYVLAGQSNMEGKGSVELMEVQKSQPIYAPFRTRDAWRVRDDVWIQFLDRKGPLTVGFGSPGCIGPELGFGWVVGDRTKAPVLLIKTAWGGKSLWRDFRSPSAGLPDQGILDKLLADERKRRPDATPQEIKDTFGAYYRAMLSDVRDTLTEMGTRFPELRGRKAEIKGLAWFQGWNDMIDAKATAEYTSNLGHFIRDLRRDFGVPNLPVVVGQMGVEGAKPSANIAKFKAAEAAVMDFKEFEGNVAIVKTDAFWDNEAQAVFDSGWKEHPEEWKRVGSNYPYHYLGSARTMIGIGRALADAMLELEMAKRQRLLNKGS